MPPKTLYVKDERLWEKAKRLAGHQGFSGVIMQLLARWVADKEKQEAMKSGKKFTEIELWVGGDHHRSWHPKDPIERNYKVAFTGRLLDSTEGQVSDITESGIRTLRNRSINPLVEVYEMSDGKLAVYRDFREVLSTEGATCLIYPHFKALCRDQAALETQWDITQEDEMQMAGVAPYATRTQKEEAITLMALAASQLQQVDDAWKRKGQEKEIVKKFLLSPVGSVVFTEEEIDLCYEAAKQEAYDVLFQESIAGALGAELIVRIDQPL